MGWARSSFWVWLGVWLATGCSGKYDSGPDEPPPRGADAGGASSAPSATGGNSARPYAGSTAAGGDPMTSQTGSGTGEPLGDEVTLNCGTWVRCDDSSACAAGEDCIALPGCQRGICATPRLVCQLYCGSSACEAAPAGLTRVRLTCPDARLDGFESSAGSGGYPPGYPM